MFELLMRQVEKQNVTEELTNPKLADVRQSRASFKVVQQSKAPNADTALINFRAKLKSSGSSSEKDTQSKEQLCTEAQRRIVDFL